MDSALGRSQTHAKSVGDFEVREPGHISQDDRFTVLERKRRKPGNDLPAELASLNRGFRERFERAPARHLLDRRDLDGDKAPAARASESGIDANPVEPREEGGVAPVAVEIPPRLDECVLSDFLDITSVVE